MKAARRSGPSALDLLEESVHHVRAMPASLLLGYYVGSAPFVLGVLFFWADMSRGAFAESRCATGALGLAVLFLWMKTWHAVFAARVRERLANETPRPWTARRIGRVVAIQAAVQPIGLVVVPAAAVLTVPFAWIYAFFQNVTALADRADGVARHCAALAWRLARLWSSPNHGALFIVLFVGLVAWLNVVIALIAVPHLLKMLLGVESDFTLSFWTFFNTTFVAVTAGLTWLAVDPVIKTFYVLRCFRGEALASGEDLRADLRAIRARITRTNAAWPATTSRLLLLSASAWLLSQPVVAAGPGSDPTPAPVTQTGPAPAELDQALDSVLARREYTWREPRERVATDGNESQDWLGRAVDSIMKSLREALETAGRAVARFFDWLTKRSRLKQSGDTSLFDWTAGFATLFWILVVVALGVLIVQAVRAWRRARATKVVEAVPAGVVPDLRDENIGAEQLPEDGWLSLARELAAKGELRLALRALYLASLAHLARREFIVLARFKSNREYEREVARRARAQPQLAVIFTENVGVFDRVWYGRHAVTPELLAVVEGNVAQLRAS